MNIAEARSNKVLDIVAIIPIADEAKLTKLPAFFQEHFKILEDNDFGKCISAKSLSQDKFVEQTKERIHRMIQGYKIPVQGYYWYKGSIEAFLGYRSEEISVFMQRANGVY